nr:E3 ubiquitin-protein ligase UPL1 [Tanacetum cinerariifolium]
MIITPINIETHHHQTPLPPNAATIILVYYKHAPSVHASSVYKQILGVKVTYHDIESVDPELKVDVGAWMRMKKSTSYVRKQRYACNISSLGEALKLARLYTFTFWCAIRPQINSSLDGFSELIPRELISMFNDKELELLISGLPEINLNDLQANTEYSGYTAASNAVMWFWEIIKAFNKEDRVPLEGFKSLQGISGPQRFQIHKAYGAPESFNQLDLSEYKSVEQLQERLLLVIHEGSEEEVGDLGLLSMKDEELATVDGVLRVHLGHLVIRLDNLEKEFWCPHE